MPPPRKVGTGSHSAFKPNPYTSTAQLKKAYEKNSKRALIGGKHPCELSSTDIEELAKKYSLTVEQANRLLFRFSMLDKDKHGFLHVHKIAEDKFFKNNPGSAVVLGLFHTHKEPDAITAEHFLATMSHFVGSNVTVTTESRLKHMVDLFDRATGKTRSLKIIPHSILELCREMGVTDEEAQAQAVAKVFTDFDTDNDGVIHFKDIKEFCEENVTDVDKCMSIDPSSPDLSNDWRTRVQCGDGDG